MKTTIYYFSGSGNSFQTARELAARLGETKLLSISSLVAQGKELKHRDERIGLVVPTYCWGLPRLVTRFVDLLRAAPNTLIFSVVTCGGSIGTTPDFTGIAISSRWDRLMATITQKESVMKALFSLVLLGLLILGGAGCSDDDPTPEGGFVYNGKTYRGMGEVLNSASPGQNEVYEHLVITEPAVARFKTDGFFTLKGANSDVEAYQFSLVKVTKLSTSSPEALWFVRGDFNQRIWLPFGPGQYRVTVHKTKISSCGLDDYDRGEISGYTHTAPYGTNGVYTLIVENTRDEIGEFIYPSFYIQSDHDQIRAQAKSLLAGVSGASNQIRKLHDFVVTHLEYDSASATSSSQRKRQDALATLKNKQGINKGYSQLYAALLRASGFKTKYITGIKIFSPHIWNAVHDGTDWRYVDTTSRAISATTIFGLPRIKCRAPIARKAITLTDRFFIRFEEMAA